MSVPAYPPSQSTTPDPQPPNFTPSPVPGTPGYVKLQIQIMKRTLAGMPEPRRGQPAGFPGVRDAIEQWSRMIADGEMQIRRFGTRVDLELLKKTVQLQFQRTLIYWRMFRLMDLPPEIISNIFHLVVWSTSHPSEGVKQRLRLTWVCSAWRRMMIEDSMLWNALWFHDAPPYERSWEWFRRAGSARLDVRLNEVDPKWAKVKNAPKFTAERMSALLDRLFTKLSQIRMLVVIVEDWPPAVSVLQKLQSAGNANIPINIERLEIHRSGTPYIWIGPGFDTPGHRFPAVLFGGHTQRLKYLCLSGIHIDFEDTSLSNLTTLDLRHIAMDSSPTLARFREILSSCPRLDKLTLDGCGPLPEGKLVERPPIQLPYLRTLALGSFNVGYVCFVIAQIRAPRVRDLTLMTLNGSDYTPMFAMLTRKFEETRILTLYNVQVDTGMKGRRVFVRFLDAMPKIGYARIARMNPEVLYWFSENPQKYRNTPEGDSESSEGVVTARAVLCPKFQCMEVQALPAETIVEFCRLREDVGVPMKKLYLNTPWAESLTPEDLDSLRKETTLFIAPVGANTHEENVLLSEGWGRE